MEKVKLVGGQWLMAHAASRCVGEVCCIHNPTDHHMREWPQNWRYDGGKMERICPHGIGHPDPDDITFKLGDVEHEEVNWRKVHGCDGCCKKEE